MIYEFIEKEQPLDFRMSSKEQEYKLLLDLFFIDY